MVFANFLILINSFLNANFSEDALLAYQQKYLIDPGHTTVMIRVKRFGIIDVIGRFQEVEGEVYYDPENKSNTSASVTIKTESYTANNPDGENAVKSEAFLHIAKFPEIKFESKKSFVKEGKNYITGDLTIHGTTNEVEFPYRIIGPKLDLPSQKQSIGIYGNLVINRQDYGITFDRKLPDGSNLIGNEVKIELVVLAIAQ